MSGNWAGAERRDKLPSWWPVTVRRIIARDPQCMCTGCPKCWRGPMDGGLICQRPSAEADHIVPRSRGGSHQDSNLRGICSKCHGLKSSQEGLEAREEKKKPTGIFEESHPGDLW